MKNNIFAIPVKDTLGIVAGGHNTTCAFPPNALKHVKCIVELDDLPIVGNYIVILEHSGRNIGILTTETHLVRILANSI